MSSTFQFSDSELGDFVLNLDPVIPRMDDDQFLALCRRNEDLRIEQSSAGDLIIKPGTGGVSGRRNAELTTALTIWTKADGSGLAFDSSTIFLLPNGARRSPDSSWIRKERWELLTPSEQEKFPPICPDFVVELRSRTDSVRNLLDKVGEYVANGAQLGWLIDPVDRRVYLCRPNSEVEILDDPKAVSGEPLLRGFELSMAAIWD